MHPAVKSGLDYFNEMKGPNAWCAIEIIFLSEHIEPVVRLEIGSISSDGVKQVRQITRNYFYDYERNESFWHDRIHS